MIRNQIHSVLLLYLVDNQLAPGDRLPSLADLSQELGVSIGKLREELEVARQMGVVSVRPRLGTRREPFDFYLGIVPSLMFGLATGEAAFEQFSQLRQAIEAQLFDQAVTRLASDDKKLLRELVIQARSKLEGDPVHIPNGEHRDLHLTIFRKLNNPFVQSLLRAYWDAYEATELTRFADYSYWLEVWDYHERIVDAIIDGNHALGQRLLVEHFQLLPTVTATA